MAHTQSSGPQSIIHVQCHGGPKCYFPY